MVVNACQTGFYMHLVDFPIETSYTTKNATQTLRLERSRRQETTDRENRGYC